MIRINRHSNRYTEAFKQTVVNTVKSGTSLSKTSKLYNISAPLVLYWKNKINKIGSLENKYYYGKILIKEPEKINEIKNILIKENNLNPNKIAKKVKSNYYAIVSTAKRIGFIWDKKQKVWISLC